MEKTLLGKTALITGSTQGLGREIAERLAAAGCRIALNGFGEADEIEALQAEIRATHGVEVFHYGADLTKPPEIVDLIARVTEKLGPIDILVNNAGMQRRAPLEQFKHEDWRELMATNLDSVYYVSRAVALHMIPRGRGKIINIGSIQCELARPGIAPYTASKGAIKNLTKGMCADWARHGLQINAIGPGYFDTPLNKALIEDPLFDDWLRKRTPAGRWGRLEDLHGAAVFLASGASDFVNGQTLYVDGGILAVI
jgi:gluconate 5-dehydrogenase